MEKMYEMTLDYIKTRKQFGTAIGKFQAIQHQISEMAVELAASNAALSSLKITNKLKAVFFEYYIWSRSVEH